MVSDNMFHEGSPPPKVLPFWPLSISTLPDNAPRGSYFSQADGARTHQVPFPRVLPRKSHFWSGPERTKTDNENLPRRRQNNRPGMVASRVPHTFLGPASTPKWATCMAGLFGSCELVPRPLRPKGRARLARARALSGAPSCVVSHGLPQRRCDVSSSGTTRRTSVRRIARALRCVARSREVHRIARRRTVRHLAMRRGGVRRVAHLLRLLAMPRLDSNQRGRVRRLAVRPSLLRRVAPLVRLIEKRGRGVARLVCPRFSSPAP